MKWVSSLPAGQLLLNCLHPDRFGAGLHRLRDCERLLVRGLRGQRLAERGECVAQNHLSLQFIGVDGNGRLRLHQRGRKLPGRSEISGPRYVAECGGETHVKRPIVDKDAVLNESNWFQFLKLPVRIQHVGPPLVARERSRADQQCSRDRLRRIDLIICPPAVSRRQRFARDSKRTEMDGRFDEVGKPAVLA
jgi:hypothetical protein